jgi:hypothetical protein
VHIIDTTSPIIYFTPRTAAVTVSFTADTTIYTADTTLFTADMTTQPDSYSFTIVDEQTKEVFTGSLPVDVSGNYTSGELLFTPLEGHFYTVELKAGAVIAYRGKIYCTDQTPLDTYTTQSGIYDALAGTNEYKTV